MSELANEKNRVLNMLTTLEPGTKEYNEVLSVYVKLHDVHKTSFSIHNSAIVAGATQLLVSMLVINHERLNVITTKALSFVKK